MTAPISRDGSPLSYTFTPPSGSGMVNTPFVTGIEPTPPGDTPDTTPISDTPASSNPLGALGDLYGAITSLYDVFAFITDPQAWKRVGVGAAGIIALFFAIRKSGVLKGATSTVSKGVKAVAS